MHFNNTLKRGDLEVTKTSEDGLVEGTTFHLYGTSLSGLEVDEYAVADSAGVARFEDVLIGTGYVLEEVDVDIRYVVPEAQSATIEWNKVTQKSFHNILKKFRVTVTKSDSETGTAQGDASLAGATYGIYKGETLIDSYTTDENSQFTTQYYVCDSDWSIREINPSEGYLLDPTVYHVGAEPELYTIELNDTAIDATEEIIKGNIAIIKHTDDGETQIETPEAGAEFEVFLKSAGSYEAAKETERDYLICDENGFCQSVDLPYGIYTVRQTLGWPGRELIEFEVYIAQDGQTYRFLINNANFESYIKIVKVDAETGKVIPYAGAGFQLYRPDGSLITQTFTYPEITEIDTFYTNAEGYKKDPENPKQWIIDEEAAEVVRKIYRLCIEGNGIETTARILQESGILTPTYYWAKKGIRKGGKKTQDNPCKWCKTTITKILTLQEYTGVLINFKTYSKSFKDKRRRENPEENQRVFENHHEPIIDRSTWETVQKIRAGTKRRQPKNSEKNMFAGLLYCADCGHKLHYNINHPNSAIEYFNCSNYRGNRGTCNETHYVRADSLEQVVLLELNRMVSYLQENEEEFAELLARKTSQDYEREKRFRKQKLAELNARYSEVDMLFERTYEDNVSGKLSDERFMKLSQRYDEEQQSLKKEIAELESICDKEDSRVYSKNQFLKAVRKFMQMKTLTPTMLHELVERIDVYHIQGTGKNRTQRLVIHYKFVGVLDLPQSPVLPENVVLNSRQGVEIEYLVGKAG